MKLLWLVLLGMTQVGWGQTILPPTAKRCGSDTLYRPEGICETPQKQPDDSSVVIGDGGLMADQENWAQENAKCKQGEVYYQKACHPITPQPEPVDVPAITKKRKQCVLDSATVVSSNYQCADVVGMECPCGKMTDVEYATCKDTSRVLLHSENGKQWCHLVQP